MNLEHADLEARFAAPAERDLPPGRHDLHREIVMNHMLTEFQCPGHALEGLGLPSRREHAEGHAALGDRQLRAGGQRLQYPLAAGGVQ